jgi:nucleoside-diphosphate-sugar epimerase
MKIVVTGATGTLGKALMYRLRDQNHSLIGLGLSKSKLKSLSDEGFEMKHCDIGDLATLRDCIAGSDIVVHCAAFAAPFGSKKKFFETNVQGTKNVFEAVKISSVSRVIAISSASIFDGMKHDLPHRDDIPEIKYRPTHHYGASKYDAELVCLSQSRDKWIGLRPRAVFGKGDQTLIPRLKKLIGKNHYKTIGNGQHLIDVTCLSNFIDAVCLAIDAPKDSLGKFYNISNGDPRTFNSIMQTYTSKYSSSFKQRKIPYYPVFLFAYFNNIIANLVPGRKWEPRITPYGLRQVTTSLVLDISGAKEALGWTPKMTFEQGMEELE